MWFRAWAVGTQTNRAPCFGAQPTAPASNPPRGWFSKIAPRTLVETPMLSCRSVAIGMVGQ